MSTIQGKPMVLTDNTQLEIAKKANVDAAYEHIKRENMQGVVGITFFVTRAQQNDDPMDDRIILNYEITVEE